MNNKDKVDLAIRGGLIAHSALHLQTTVSKASAKMVVADLVRLIRELDGKIDTLLENDDEKK